jgi:hypothetical protein
MGVGVGVLLLVGFSGRAIAQTNARALDKFVGSWKEDPSKRAVEAGIRYPLRFQASKDGGLEELRGPESGPTAQLVQFDGKPHTLPSGNTSIWRQVDANTFEQVRSDAKGVVATRRLTVSSDGKTLTEVIESRNDRTKATYRRASGAAQGLSGRWEPTSVESNANFDLKIEAVGSNSLRFSSSNAPSYELVLDGEARQVHGAATPAMRATTTSAKLLTDNSLEVREFRNKTEAIRSVYVVAADGKLMMMTVTNLAAGPNSKPSVFVVVKQ